MRPIPRLAVVVFVTAGALGAATGCSIPGTEVVDGEGIVGTYTVNGVDALDIEYSGTVVIETADGPGRYHVQWIVTGAIHEGVGTLVGDQFEVEWRTVTSPRGEASGTATYTVTDEGDLVGSRTIDGLDGVATETIHQDA